MEKDLTEASKKVMEERWRLGHELSKINEEQVWRQYEAYPGKCFQLEREGCEGDEGSSYCLVLVRVVSTKKGNGGAGLYVKYLRTKVENWSCINPGPLSVENITEDAYCFPRNYHKKEITSKEYEKYMTTIKSKFKEFFRG
jgi:hypothetical protein